MHRSVQCTIALQNTTAGRSLQSCTGARLKNLTAEKGILASQRQAHCIAMCPRALLSVAFHHQRLQRVPAVVARCTSAIVSCQTGL